MIIILIQYKLLFLSSVSQKPQIIGEIKTSLTQT